jgi:hypothetical protein
MVAIWALANDRPWLAGLAIGVLWYKPTLALGLLFLLLVRSRWRELGVALLVGAAAFLLSVAAAGGDWGWLSTWLAGARVWLPADAASNADKATSLPGLLARLPLPWFVPLTAGFALAAVATRGLRRAGIVEAASAACLLGLAAGPRAWGYEAAMAFPFVCWALAGGVGSGAAALGDRVGDAPDRPAEPWRSRLIVAAYLMGPLWLFSSITRVSAVAVVVLTATGLWMWRWRPRREASAAAIGAPTP